MAPIFTGRAFGFGRVDAAGAATIPQFSATGGNLNYSDPQYSFYIFTSPGTFTVTENTKQSTAEVFVVAGGGGGGTGGDLRNPTGGGAGGIAFASIPAPNITAGSYPVEVGVLGSGSGPPPAAPGPLNYPGGNSTFSYGATTITAIGGGAGTSWRERGSAAPGGSGGGYDPSPYTPNVGGTGIQPSQNSGNPHIIAQFGNPGGGTWGGAAGPGSIPFYTPGPSFGPTVNAVYPGQSYGLNQGSGGWGCGGGAGTSGTGGIVIIRTLKSTP